MITILKDDKEFKQVADLKTAREAIEDDAVDTWVNSVDPNVPDARLYPGIEWTGNTAFLAIGRGGVSYSILTEE